MGARVRNIPSPPTNFPSRPRMLFDLPVEVQLRQDDVRLCDMRVVPDGGLQQVPGLLVVRLLAALRDGLPVKVPC